MSTTLQKTIKTWNSRKKEIWSGEMSIPSFRNNLPIDIHGNSIQIIKKEWYYIASVSLFIKFIKKTIYPMVNLSEIIDKKTK